MTKRIGGLLAAAALLYLPVHLRASQAARPAAPVCRTVNKIDLSIADLRSLIQRVASGEVTLADATRRVDACGVHFPLLPSVTEAWWKEIPSGMEQRVREACGRYERVERGVFDYAVARRTAEIWEGYVALFSDSPYAPQAAAEAGQSVRFAWLTQQPVIRAELSPGLNQLDYSLLHLWRDGDAIRAFFRVYVREAGQFSYHTQSETRGGTLGYDDAGRPLRKEKAFLLNRAGEEIKALAAAKGDSFYLDMSLAGAAPDARSITLLSLPYLRGQQYYSSYDGARKNYFSYVTWQLPIVEGRPPVKVLQALASVVPLADASPLAEWACGQRCPASESYFGDPFSRNTYPTQVPIEVALHSIRVRFLGATRGLDPEPDGRRPIAFVYALTNESTVSQYLGRTGDTGDRFLIQGSDDMQRPVVLRWYRLLDAKFRPADNLWLAPKGTGYLVLEAAGLHDQATQVVLRGRLMINQNDEVRFRLPAR